MTARAALAIAVLVAGVSAAVPRGLTIETRARAMEIGEVVAVTVTTDAPADDVRVRAFDREQLVYRESPLVWRALVGIDLATSPGPYSMRVDVRTGTVLSQAVRELVVLPHAFPTRQLTVDDAYVNPPPATLERIAKEAKDLERIWTSPSSARLWAGAFQRPVPQANNSAFGSRSVFNGEPRSPHSGADFNSPAGQAIAAPNAGKVVLARDLYFTGNTVIIDHGLGLFSMMAHLSAIDVSEGDSVTAGATIGRVGATGRVTGPHLHWAIRLNGARVDPLSLLFVLDR